MSSTDPDRGERARRFHDEELARVAGQLPGPHFPMAPDRQGATSYWEDRSDGVPAILTIDDAEMEELLRAQWAKEPPLAELVPALLALARELVPEDEVEEDLDPYIYRMF